MDRGTCAGLRSTQVLWGRGYEEQGMRAARLGLAVLKRLPVDTNRVFFGNRRKLSELGRNLIPGLC